MAVIAKIDDREITTEQFIKLLKLNGKFEQLIEDIAFLRGQADKAKANDPVKGLSAKMPIARVDSYRACFGGECPIGNLFTDALRWYTGADFAFIQSGGVRGLGWPEGPVKVRE